MISPRPQNVRTPSRALYNCIGVGKIGHRSNRPRPPAPQHMQPQTLPPDFPLSATHRRKKHMGRSARCGPSAGLLDGRVSAGGSPRPHELEADVAGLNGGAAGGESETAEQAHGGGVIGRGFGDDAADIGPRKGPVDERADHLGGISPALASYLRRRK